MKYFYSCVGWILLAFFLVLSSTNALAVKNYFEISASEARMLPKFCKTGFTNLTQKERIWMNHLCPGLNALNHAKLIYDDNSIKKYALQSAFRHFEYTLGHATNTSYNAFIFLKRGEAYELSGDVVKALSDYQKALVLKPKNIAIHIALIDIYIKLGDLDNARELVSRGLKIKPKSKSLLRRKKKLN
jgi:tetratricopeptide (TPR) repeat protein